MSRTTAPAKSCASSSAKASWMTASVEIDVRERNTPSFEIISNQGVEEMDINLKDILPNLFGQRTKKRKMKVGEAFEYLVQEEESRLIDMDQVTRTASSASKTPASSSSTKSIRSPGAKAATAPTSRAKACSATSCPSSKAPPSIPATAWCAPTTFSSSPPEPFTSRSPAISFPSCRAVSHPRRAAVAYGRGLRPHPDRAQVVADQAIHRAARNGRAEAGVHPGGIRGDGRFAFRVNETTENIGARRLHTIMERVLDEISFLAPDLTKAHKTILQSTWLPLRRRTAPPCRCP